MSREQLEKLAKDSEWVETFMTKVNPEGDGPLETPCWEWTGGLDKAGYGRIHVKKHGGGKGKNYFAHRVCYMIHRGYIERRSLFFTSVTTGFAATLTTIS